LPIDGRGVEVRGTEPEGVWVQLTCRSSAWYTRLDFGRVHRPDNNRTALAWSDLVQGEDRDDFLGKRRIFVPPVGMPIK
jgi:hypothetical protein